MSTFALRKRLIDIAKKDVGSREVSRNRGPAISKFWPTTLYPEGYKDRAPYCAAAMCYWVKEWLKDPEVLAALNMTSAQARLWRCKSAAAFGWLSWAKNHRLEVFGPASGKVIHTGDIVVFGFSHIGLVVDDSPGQIKTIEANTSAGDGGSQRDGGGVWEKTRTLKDVRAFIRLLT